SVHHPALRSVPTRRSSDLRLSVRGCCGESYLTIRNGGVAAYTEVTNCYRRERLSRLLETSYRSTSRKRNVSTTSACGTTGSPTRLCRFRSVRLPSTRS